MSQNVKTFVSDIKKNYNNYFPFAGVNFKTSYKASGQLRRSYFEQSHFRSCVVLLAVKYSIFLLEKFFQPSVENSENVLQEVVWARTAGSSNLNLNIQTRNLAPAQGHYTPTLISQGCP